MSIRLSSTLWTIVVAVGCGAAPARPPVTPQLLPSDADQVEAALDAFGRRLYLAAAAGHPERVLLDADRMHALLSPEAAAHELDLRLHGARRLTPDETSLFNAASYAGICVQNGWNENTDGPVGLRAPGYVFERALLIGLEPSGGAIASWAEGRFLHTDAGFEALELVRLEAPRRDHADLELAVCELRAGRYKHNP